MSVNPRIEELRRRVQADPASIAFAALAEEYRRVGSYNEAIEACIAGLKRHPSYVSARVTLGRALVEIGDFDAASVELEQVLRSAPENLAAIRTLADIHRRRGEIPETIDQYDTSSDPANLATAPPTGPPPVSARARIAVKSAHVEVAPVPAGLNELEAFLAAIVRVRSDVPMQAVR